MGVGEIPASRSCRSVRGTNLNQTVVVVRVHGYHRCCMHSVDDDWADLH